MGRRKVGRCYAIALLTQACKTNAKPFKDQVMLILSVLEVFKENDTVRTV